MKLSWLQAILVSVTLKLGQGDCMNVELDLQISVM